MEEKTQRELNFSLGIFDEISDKIRDKILQESSECENYGVGVYTDEFVINNFMTYPSKNIEERQAIVRSIDGVDFTFQVSTSDPSKVKEIIKNAYKEYLQNKN